MIKMRMAVSIGHIYNFMSLAEINHSHPSPLFSFVFEVDYLKSEEDGGNKGGK